MVPMHSGINRAYIISRLKCILSLSMFYTFESLYSIFLLTYGRHFRVTHVSLVGQDLKYK